MAQYGKGFKGKTGFDPGSASVKVDTLPLNHLGSLQGWEYSEYICQNVTFHVMSVVTGREY